MGEYVAAARPEIGPLFHHEVAPPRPRGGRTDHDHGLPDPLRHRCAHELEGRGEVGILQEGQVGDRDAEGESVRRGLLAPVRGVPRVNPLFHPCRNGISTKPTLLN